MHFALLVVPLVCITCAAAPTHGGAVCVVWPFVKEGGACGPLSLVYGRSVEKCYARFISPCWSDLRVTLATLQTRTLEQGKRSQNRPDKEK